MSVMTSLTRMWLTRSTRPFVFTNEYDQRLPFEACPDLGLYVHIPFCEHICGFCPYCKTVYSKEICDRYLDALIREIHLVGNQADSKKTVTSLYFGGGTPALAADRMAEIIRAVEEHFHITDGIGVELHPDNVTPSLLQTLKDAGVTRISIGIQSFQEKFQTVLGRRPVDRAADFERFFSVPLKKAYGFELAIAKRLGFITEVDGVYRMTLNNCRASEFFLATLGIPCYNISIARIAFYSLNYI